MRVKSKTNIITNSSSECFSVRNHGGTVEVASKWFKYLEDNYKELYGTSENPLWSGVYDASIYMEGDKVFIDYPILCNIDDILGKLCDCFNEDNVEDED
jgi:hypothetical protein